MGKDDILQEAKVSLMLIIMDGLGIGDGSKDDAVAMAETPVLDKLKKEATTRGKYGTLGTHGEFVGLWPSDQMGNSEVGHGTLGSGRISLESLPKITKAIKDTTLFKNEELLDLIKRLKATGGKLHMMALLSSGGVHSHIDHAIAMANFVAGESVPVIVHASIDGRDVAPTSAAEYLDKFKAETAGRDITIATVIGREHSMERTDKFSSIQMTYNAIMYGAGKRVDDVNAAIEEDYAEQRANLVGEQIVRDERVKPIILGNYQGIEPADAIMTMNFRSDRMKRICAAFFDPESWRVERKFGSAGEPQFPRERFFAITEYSAELAPYMTILIPKEKIPNCLGEVLSKAGRTQLRAAENEKGAHVTSFFNGGREAPFPGEERVIIPSPDVPFDQKPEMSAKEIADAVIARKAKGYDLTVINFANPDMVGHTGNFAAVVKGVEAVDTQIGRLVAEFPNHIIWLIADHGNAEKMRGPDGMPDTKHTTNLVPSILITADRSIGRTDSATSRQAGLADVAPTILTLMGIEIPIEMTGQPLFQVAGRELGGTKGKIVQEA